MTALWPVRIVVGFERIYFFVTLLILALTACAFASTARHDAERGEFLQSDQFVGHHVGTTDLKPALDGIVFAGDELDAELRLTVSRGIVCHLVVQVVAHHTVLDVVSHIAVVECSSGIVADTGLEALRGGEVHVLRVCHGGTVHEEIIGEDLVDMLIDFCAPHTVAVALHGDGLAEDLTSELHLLGIGSLHAEDHAVILVLGREDGAREETGHHTSRELLLLACGGEGGLSVLHRLLSGCGIVEQRQGLAQEVFGVHPGMAELIMGVLLHAADAVFVEELHIVAGIAIEEIVCAHTEPEQTDLAVRISGIVIDTRDICRGE